MQTPFQLPTEMFGMFKLEALNLGYYDNYLYVGLNPIFVAPKVSEVEYTYCRHCAEEFDDDILV